MGRAVSGSMPSALGLRAPKAQREWARPLSNWPPKLRRTVRLRRTRLPKPLSSWPRIVPVSFMGQSLQLMEGALPFEVCGRHDPIGAPLRIGAHIVAITPELERYRALCIRSGRCERGLHD